MKTKKLLALTLSFIMASSCMSINAFAETGECYLDLDSSTADIGSSKTIDQNYSATVTTNKTDVTKVQVSWEIENITVTVTNNKIWDTDKLQWVEDTSKDDSATAEPVTAKFDFKNLSSLKIDAQVEFNVNKAANFTEITPTFTDDTTTGDGKITLDTKATSADSVNTGNITVDITPEADDFKSLTATGTGKYGTYTVTISENKKL